MKVKFDFNLEAWIQDVEIEATSVDEAREMLMAMSLIELLENDYTIRGMEISEVESEVTERDVEVRVDNIKYDLGDDVEGQQLPTSFVFRLTDVGVDENLTDIVEDEIYSETGHWTTSFDYDVLSEM